MLVSALTLQMQIFGSSLEQQQNDTMLALAGITIGCDIRPYLQASIRASDCGAKSWDAGPEWVRDAKLLL